MAYKSISTVLTSPEGDLPELEFATALADAQDAHLEVLCIGIDRTPNTYFEIGSNAVVMQASIEEAHARAEKIRERLESHPFPTALRWDARSSISANAGVGRTVASNARFCDLAVVRQPFGSNTGYEANMILEGLLFEADCPVVVVPEEAEPLASPETMLIAWNESAEAMRAVKQALPFLRAASNVHIAIIDPPESGPERSDPGGALAVYLFRHGIRSDIQVMTRQGQRVSERLSQNVTETGSDMLVMGGYGHSRFREAVLGGATRDMLEHSKVPVFMAH